MRVGIPSLQPRMETTRVPAAAPQQRRVEVPPERTELAPVEIRGSLERGYAAVTGRAADPIVIDVLAAQVATETGYGAKMVGYNFGGIKGTSPEGKSAVCSTREVIGGREVTLKDSFRAYDSADSGAADYVRLLERRFPEALEAAAKGDVEGFARALKAKGYFTADEGAYARAMRGAMGSPAQLGGPRDVGARAPSARPVGEASTAGDGFATASDLARVVDAIAASALRLAASRSSSDESQEP